MTLTELKSKCPGLYCGRQFTDSINGSMTWSDCGACPRGYRVNIMSDISECMPCENNPSTYDWLYLGFMAMLPLILHWFFIDLAAKERWSVSHAIVFCEFRILNGFLVCVFSILASPKVRSSCISAHLLKYSHRPLLRYWCTNHTGHWKSIRVPYHGYPIGTHSSIIQHQTMKRNCIVHKKQSIHCKYSVLFSIHF